MTKLMFLGKHAGQTDVQETVSFALKDDKYWLFEIGPSIVRLLRKAKISPMDLDVLFISHSHGDHVLGFPYLMFVENIERGLHRKTRRTIPMVTLPLISENLLKFTKFCYPTTDFLTKIKLLETSEKDFCTFDIQNHTVITAPVLHGVPTIGVRIEHPDFVVAYSSDTMYCENVVELARNCDLLIHSAFCTSKNADFATKVQHATAKDAARVANEAKAKRLALVDISFLVEEENLLTEEAETYFNGDVFIPKEFEEIEV